MSSLQPGASLGPYEIVGILGAGGMGEVYRARDRRLDRDVAVKVLPEAMSLDAERLRRFEKEARATGALDHPNVLAIHDVGVHDGIPYLVEELLEGTTLRELLATGPLPPSKAIEYAVQIAGGLAAAHGRGIVHRDLKPANVFVTSDGRLKILDFGLAKLVGADAPVGPYDATRVSATATQAGRMLGTLGYMAPEQVRGQTVDHRADIFALGCVLHEMLAGVRAFVRDSAAETIAAILSEDPDPLPRSVPGPLRSVVRRCLQKRPDDRFQSARDVGFALQGGTQTRPDVGDAARAVRPRRAIAVRLPLWAAGVVVLAGLAAAGATWGRRWLAPPPLPALKRVAVLSFTPADGDAALAATAGGLSEVVARGLMTIERDQPPGCWTVPQREAASLGAGAAADLYKKLGVNLAVGGRLRRGGDRLRLDLTVIDPGGGATLRSAVVEDRAANLASFQDGLVTRVAAMVGFELGGEAAGRLAAASTTMRDSFLAYVEALGVAAAAHDDAALARAAALLETATARDPLFAQAWLALGRVHLRRFELTRDAAWVEHAAAVATRVVSDRRWADEGYRLLAAAHTIGKRPQEAVAALDHAAAVAPASAELAVERAVALQAAGRAGDAEREFQRAIFMRPGYWPPHHLLAKLYLSQGRYEAAATQWREVIDCAPRFTRGYNNLGNVYFRLGRTAEARAVFERSLAIEPSRVALSNLGTLYFDEARFGDAVAVLERALATDDTAYKTWGNLGFAYKYGGVPEKAPATFRRAVELAEARLRETPGDVGVVTDLAGYAGALGERERGLAVIEPVLATSPSDPLLIADIAECLWDLGDRDRAFEWVERALRAGVARRRFENRPTLRELVADQRYRHLVEQLARPT